MVLLFLMSFTINLHRWFQVYSISLLATCTLNIRSSQLIYPVASYKFTEVIFFLKAWFLIFVAGDESKRVASWERSQQRRLLELDEKQRADSFIEHMDRSLIPHPRTQGRCKSVMLCCLPLIVQGHHESEVSKPQHRLQSGTRGSCKCICTKASSRLLAYSYR